MQESFIETLRGGGGRNAELGGAVVSEQTLSIPCLPLQMRALDQGLVSAGLYPEKTAWWAGI